MMRATVMPHRNGEPRRNSSVTRGMPADALMSLDDGWCLSAFRRNRHASFT